MGRRGSGVSVLLASAALLAAWPSSAWFWSKADVECRWKDRDIAVDGRDSEWQDHDPDDVDVVSLSCFNDKSDLYLYLTPRDRGTQLQLIGEFGQTLTFWFDARGNDRKERSKSNGLQLTFKAPDGNGGLKAMLRYGPGPIETSDLIQKMEWVGASTAPAAGVEARIGLAGRRMFYELKIPLASARLAADSKKPFGLGLETSPFSDQAADELGQLKRGAKKGGPSPGGQDSQGGNGSIFGGGFGGGGVGGGGGMGGGMGGRRGMGRRAKARQPGIVIPEPFELWPSVQLAGQKA